MQAQQANPERPWMNPKGFLGFDSHKTNVSIHDLVSLEQKMPREGSRVDSLLGIVPIEEHAHVHAVLVYVTKAVLSDYLEKLKARFSLEWIRAQAGVYRSRI